MSEIVFHCGLHKTGSTFLQEKVFPFANPGQFIRKQEVGPWLNNLSDASGPVICSAEYFSGFIFSGDYKKTRSRMLRYISEHWPESGLILFLREPSEFSVSVYMQYIQMGGTLEFKDFFNFIPLSEALYFDSFIYELKDMGWGDILLFDHAQLKNEPKRVIRIIENFVGCSFEGYDHSGKGKSNVSISRNGARLLRKTTQWLPYKWELHFQGARRTSKVLKKLGISPRDLIQSGFLSGLNKFGAPLVNYKTVEEVRKKYELSWENAKQMIDRTQKGMAE